MENFQFSQATFVNTADAYGSVRATEDTESCSDFRVITEADPIYGEVEIPVELAPLLSTRAVARLRNLKQLGVCYKAYPSATHTRYAHSLGVAYLAFTFATTLNQRVFARFLGDTLEPSNVRATREEILQITCAGLLHDLGHGPFSHLFEKFMKNSSAHDSDAAEQWHHEDMSLQLIELAFEEVKDEWSDQKAAFFHNSANLEAVQAMVRGRAPNDGAKRWLYSLVSDEQYGVDVDRLDYLMRDPYTALGHEEVKVQYDSLLRAARICADCNGDTMIAYEKKERVHELVDDVFKSRARLHTRVYQCGRVLAAERNVLKLLAAAEPYFQWSQQAADPALFVHLDDTILCDLRKCREKHAGVHEAQRTLKLMEKDLGWVHLKRRSLPRDTEKHCTIGALEGKIRKRVLEPLRQTWQHLCEPLLPQLGPQGVPELDIGLADVSEGVKRSECGIGVNSVPFWFPDPEDRARVVAHCWKAEDLERSHTAAHMVCKSVRKLFCNLFVFKLSHEPQLPEDELTKKFGTLLDSVFPPSERSAPPRKRACPDTNGDKVAVDVVPDSAMMDSDVAEKIRTLDKVPDTDDDDDDDDDDDSVGGDRCLSLPIVRCPS